MTPQAFDAACRALPAVTVSVQWGDDQVYKVGGKMFAVMGPGAARGGVSFKVSDLAYVVLVETGAAVPAPYLARARWVHIAALATVDDAEMIDWLANAHALVAARLTRKVRAALDLG